MNMHRVDAVFMDEREPQTVAGIFKALGGTSAVATMLDVGQSTASEMKRRGSIPVRHWDRFIGQHSEGLGRPITLEDLHEAHRARLTEVASESVS